jgi:hypothetical protein
LYGLWDLPFRSSNPILNRIIGGWQVSSIFTAQSGLPLTVTQGSQVWGGSLFLGFNSGAIPTVNPSQWGNSVNRDVKGSNNIGVNSDPARRGSGLNLFANPEQVFNSFRRVELSRDGRSGRANPLRGFPRWNIDASIAKSTQITETVAIRFSADFFNLPNHPIFNNPALNLTAPQTFGVVTSQFVPNNRIGGERWIQLGLRVEF